MPKEVTRPLEGGAGFIEIRCGPKVQTLFVVIPGIGTLRPDSWDDGNEDIWLRSIETSSAPDVGIFAFENKLCASGDGLSWRQIEEEGARFLSALQDFVEKEELQKCPIVLVAHSLGGLTLKRAMCLAYRQSQRFRNLRRNIAGAILLACPHSRSDDVKVWQNVSLICWIYTKGNSKHTINSSLASGLAEDSWSFEQAFDQIPVLSIYETMDTRVGGLISSKVRLVSKSFTKLNTSHESQLGVKADHNNISCVQFGSPEFMQVTEFIDEAVHNARQVIKKGSEEYIRPIALDESTVAGTVRSRSSFASLHQAQSGSGSKGETSSSFLGPQLHTSKDGTAGSTAASIEIIPSLSDFTIEKSDPVLPCYMMPLGQNRGFFGRTKILEEITEILSPTSDSTEIKFQDNTYLKTYALCGPGGMGKTQIATEFVYRSKSRFDAIFWVTADEPSKMATSFGNIATTLGLIASDSTDARDEIFTRDLVLGWLAHPLKSYSQLDEKESEASWLLVFDNVDNPDILDNYWPRDSSGSVLITSRDPLVKTYIYSADSGIMLPPFGEDEATSFLLKLTGRERDVEERSQGSAVAKTLGGYPLAIAQLAPVIARNDLGFQEFLQMYEKEKARSQLFELQVGTSTVRTGYYHTLSTVWALDDLKKGAPLLDVLSLLDPDGIPEYILEENGSAIEWPEFPQDAITYQQARAELLQSSLITRDRTAKKIVIHRLIQDSARAKMSDERFNIVYQFTCSLLSSVWPYEDFGFGNETYRWAQCDELFSHVLRLHKLFQRFAPPVTLSETTIKPYMLFLDAAWFSIMRSRFSETRPLLDTAKAIGTSLKANQETDTSLKEEFEKLQRIYHHHSGALGEHTNDAHASLSNFEKFTRMLQEKFGDAPRGKDQSLGVAWNELGNSYIQYGRIEEAEKCMFKSMEALRVLDGSTKISINMPLINLAYVYWVGGRLEKAAATFEEALKDRIEEYGPDDRVSFVTGKLYLGLGNVRASQNRLDESFALHQKCLIHYKATVGNFHHRTGDGCVRVAHHYIRLGVYDRALELLEQALKIFSDKKLWGPDQARAHFKKGRALELQGNTFKAKLSFEQAVQLWKKRHPGDLRNLSELTDSDFDADVFFWSR